MIYFDNSATTRPCEEVIKAVNEAMTDDKWGNPGSLHKLGYLSLNAYLKAREECASVLNCYAEELFFTSCGTESANTAITGYVKANPRKGKTVISTKTEHKCTLETLELLRKEGYDIKYVSVGRDGKPDLDELSEMMRSGVSLMCFTHVNNETGAVLPVDSIVELRKECCPDAAIYLDCVQSLGKLPVDLKKTGVDMASFSGHKIHGIKGSGLLYVRKNTGILPLIIGGGQQDGMRSGTQSLPLASSMAAAMTAAEQERDSAFERVREINRFLREELKKRGAVINSPDDALPFVLNVAFKNFQSETMLHCLEMYDIYISTVSACASRSKKVSYVLENMGIERKVSSNSVRLSFSRYNTMDEAVRFIEAVDEIYKLYEVNVR